MFRKKKRKEAVLDDEEEQEEDLDEEDEEEEETEEDDLPEIKRKPGRPKKTKEDPDNDDLWKLYYSQEVFTARNVDDPKASIAATKTEDLNLQLCIRMLNLLEEIAANTR